MRDQILMGRFQTNDKKNTIQMLSMGTIITADDHLTIERLGCRCDIGKKMCVPDNTPFLTGCPTCDESVRGRCTLVRNDATEDDEWTGVLHDDAMGAGRAPTVGKAIGHDGKLPQGAEQFAGGTERAQRDVFIVAELMRIGFWSFDEKTFLVIARKEGGSRLLTGRERGKEGKGER